MNLEPDLAEVVAHHRPHGPLTGDATAPTPNGYMVSISCVCGVVFMRWSLDDAALDIVQSHSWAELLC